MKPFVCRCLLVLGVSSLLVPVAGAAMYKWIDENGNTHYGDTVPPKYAQRPAERLTRSGTVAKVERPPIAEQAQPAAPQSEEQRATMQRELERQRQDHALLSTYANEAEIELARGRELRRHQEAARQPSAELARSKNPAERKKAESLASLERDEAGRINAKFDAQKARYRELTQADPGAAPAPVSALVSGRR